VTEQVRFHDIPVSRRDVLAGLLEQLTDHGLDETDLGRFRALSRILQALFHYEFHEQLEELKVDYEHINPDRGEGRQPAPESTQQQSSRFAESLAKVLTKGNYLALEQEHIDFAFAERSLFPLQVTVNFDVFEQFVVYARGELSRPIEVKKWHGIGNKTIDVAMFERVCLMLHFKQEEELPAKERKELSCEPGMTVLKLFRNIPKADLEMLFPNTRLKMRHRDKLLIGVPAVVGGVPVAVKLTPALLALAVMFGAARGEINLTALIASLSGLVGLGAFLFRQWDKFKSRKMQFMKQLSENLYFRNLDNNEGVLTRLVDEAEEEECKEALLAFGFLMMHPQQTEQELDERIEDWFRERYDLELDFEVDDALAKLLRLELVAADEAQRYSVIELPRALAVLDKRWDELFDYNDPACAGGEQA